MNRILFCLLLCVVVCVCEEYIYVTKYIDTPVDHFSFANNDTFKLRYLINDSYWSNGGPVFFYTGNEGPVVTFAQNTGYLWEIAPAFNALVIFAEHRYYGESMPYGNTSFSDPQHLGYLTSTQALADFVFLIENTQKALKTKNDGKPSPVIAFGGSYGGMLSAWIRMKYPGSVHGALASSAPIYQFTDLTPCSKFNEILVSVFESSYNHNCVKNIKQTWKEIRDITSTDDGKTWLSNTLRLCKPLSSKNDVTKLTDWLSDVYGNLAMVNYPYPTEFLAPLPAFPILEFCKRMGGPANGKTVLQYLANALEVYTNYTKQTKCVNIDSSSANVDENGWNYQACTELIMPMCTKDNIMFEEQKWNFTEYSDACFKKFGVRVDRADIAEMEYGGKRALYTNIVFTNGLLDPWSGGGFLKSTTSAYAILIPNGAHHLELRASNPADPPSVTDTRNTIRGILASWIKGYSNK